MNETRERRMKEEKRRKERAKKNEIIIERKKERKDGKEGKGRELYLILLEICAQKRIKLS